MYTLRTIEKTGAISNCYLGNYYEIIDKQHCPERFKLYISNITKDILPTDISKCNGILISTEQEFLLYNDCEFYVMNSSGETFEKINL